jgi:hypothetical protein
MATRKKKSTSIFSAVRKQFGNENYGTRQFRRDFNKLVKSGLLKPQKNQKPSGPTPTEYALRQIRKFADVLSGEAQTFKIGTREGKAYREAGYIVKNNTAIVHAGKGAKARRVAPTDKGIPQFEVITPGKNGKEKVARRVLLPYGDLESYVNYIVYESPPLKKGEFIGFRFFGNNSIRYWFEPDAKQKLLEYFLRYQSVSQAAESGDPEEQEEIYANFEVVIFRDQKEWSQHVKEQRGRPSEERNARNRERKREWLRNYLGRMNEEERAYYNLKTREQKKSHAEAQQRYRQKIRSTDPDKILQDKEAARLRAAAYRAKKRIAKGN